MKLTVIGCSGSYPGPESPASCYLLEHDDTRILLDLGNGALGALHRHVDPLRIDGVLLSHLHPDHFMDLCGYYVMRKYHPAGPQPRIPVFGPRGTAQRLATAYGLAPEEGMHAEFDLREYGAEPIALGPFTITAARVNHPVAAYALRVEAGGAVLAYSGDTAPCDALVETARDADLFLCEASFRDDEDNPPDIHLTGSDAGAAATAAGVRRLLLTHVPPWHDPARALAEAGTTWAGPLDLARAGDSYAIGR